jgi:hypothetical protein
MRTCGSIPPHGSGSASHLFNCIPYRFKSPKVLKKSKFTQKMARILKYFIKTVQAIFFKAAEWDTKPGPDLWTRSRQKSLKMWNAYKPGSGRGPDPKIETKVTGIQIHKFLCGPQIRTGSILHTYGTDPLLRILEPQRKSMCEGIFR